MEDTLPVEPLEALKIGLLTATSSSAQLLPAELENSGLSESARLGERDGEVGDEEAFRLS